VLRNHVCIPAPDQRHYQKETCIDGVMKVLPTCKEAAIQTGEIILRMKARGLSYSNATVYQTVSKMGFVGGTDSDGNHFTSSKNGYNPKYYKTKTK
jgi:hypothetical protein